MKTNHTHQLNGTANGLERRSAEVEEIMGKMPHWIIRWGITVLLVFVGLLLFIAAFIRYPDSVTTGIAVSPEQDIAVIPSAENAVVLTVLKKDSATVNKGDTLLQLLTNSGKEIPVLAPQAGIAHFLHNTNPGARVNKDEPLVAVAAGRPAYKGELEVPGSYLPKIKTGQKVLVELQPFPRQEYGLTECVVRSVSAMPGNQQRYRVIVDLPNGLVTNRHIKLPPQYTSVRGTAEIMLEEKTVLQKITGTIKLY